MEASSEQHPPASNASVVGDMSWNEKRTSVLKGPARHGRTKNLM